MLFHLAVFQPVKAHVEQNVVVAFIEDLDRLLGRLNDFVVDREITSLGMTSRARGLWRSTLRTKAPRHDSGISLRFARSALRVASSSPRT